MQSETVDFKIIKRDKKNVLCLDSGVLRAGFTLSALQMLQERLEKEGGDPVLANNFDLIVGSGTGGLLAILIGRCGFALDQCAALLRDVASSAMKPGLMRKVAKSNRFSYSKLREVMAKWLKRWKDESLYTDDPKRPKVCVVCAKADVDPGIPFLFRSYNVDENVLKRRKYNFKGICSKQPLLEIAMACWATPFLFHAVVFDNVGQFFEGGLVCANPSLVAFIEARVLYSYAKINAIISMGTGRHPRVLTPLNENPTLMDLADRTVSTCSETAQVSVALNYMLGDDVAYHRVNALVEGNRFDESRLQSYMSAARRQLDKFKWSSIVNRVVSASNASDSGNGGDVDDETDRESSVIDARGPTRATSAAVLTNKDSQRALNRAAVEYEQVPPDCVRDQTKSEAKKSPYQVTPQVRDRVASAAPALTDSESTVIEKGDDEEAPLPPIGDAVKYSTKQLRLSTAAHQYAGFDPAEHGIERQLSPRSAAEATTYGQIPSGQGMKAEIARSASAAISTSTYGVIPGEEAPRKAADSEYGMIPGSQPAYVEDKSDPYSGANAVDPTPINLGSDDEFGQ